MTLGECLARSVPAVQRSYVGKYSFPLPQPLTLLLSVPIVCLCAFSMEISNIRESDCSVVLLHPHVLLDVSSLHLLWVVFDTCARSATAVQSLSLVSRDLFLFTCDCLCLFRLKWWAHTPTRRNIAGFVVTFALTQSRDTCSWLSLLATSPGRRGISWAGQALWFDGSWFCLPVGLGGMSRAKMGWLWTFLHVRRFL